MQRLSNQQLNQQIISGYITGKSVGQLSVETGLDSTYITLVLYQEGIHYANRQLFSEILQQRTGK